MSFALVCNPPALVLYTDNLYVLSLEVVKKAGSIVKRLAPSVAPFSPVP